MSVRARRIDQTGSRRFAVVFEQGEEVADGLLAFAREQHIAAASFTAIGALQDVVLGFWEYQTKQYRRNPIREQVEVVSLVGNVAAGPDGPPRVHAHLVVGKSDGTAYGGHLLEGHVRPTLEVMLEESPTALQRRIDPETGLALLSLDDS